MPVSALERFRTLVQVHQQDPATHEKLTKSEIQSALMDLHPEDQLEAREIALDAMMKVDLTEDALESLQHLVGIQPGVPVDVELSSVPVHSSLPFD